MAQAKACDYQSLRLPKPATTACDYGYVDVAATFRLRDFRFLLKNRSIWIVCNRNLRWK